MQPGELRQLALAALRADVSAQHGEHWAAWVGGACSLVDQFDRDGWRYVIAEYRRQNPPLSSVQRRMLAARARGTSLKVIAAELGISVPAVSRRLHRAMKKLGLNTQADLARICVHRTHVTVDKK